MVLYVNNFILFLVEKSLARINCLFDWLIDWLIDWLCVRTGQKNITIVFIRVDRRVIGIEELESDVSFVKFFSDQFFYTKNHFFYKKIFFYKGWPKGNRDRGTRIWC
jgi:hypothetical protein